MRKNCSRVTLPQRVLNDFIEGQAFLLYMILLLPSLSQSSCVSPVKLTGGEGGAKSNDSEKAWSSINHSILSVHSLNMRRLGLETEHLSKVSELRESCSESSKHGGDFYDFSNS
jgi:hypothetical protein